MYNQQSQFFISPVVKILVIINVVMYIITTFIVPTLAPHLWLYYPTSTLFQPYQLLSHMFMHDPDGLGHLIFNMIGLVMFGSVIEMVWHEQRFLFYYLACGFGATAVNFISEYVQIQNGTILPEQIEVMCSLGASGCVYGVMVAYGITFPENKLGLMFLPFQIPAKYFIPAMIGLDLYFGVTNTQTGVGHFAHYGGAITGVFIMIYWWKTKK